MRLKLELEVAPPFLPLVNKKCRYKVFYGGRGSGKSWTFARVLLTFAAMRKIRVLCARELQVSIADSVHKLLCDQIAALGLETLFTITKTGITGNNGSEFIFKGLHHNVTEIKSMEGIDYVWVEEAQSVSRESWDLLIPTIRNEGSEIWVSFNPFRPDDETYRRFVLEPPAGALVVKVGWEDNPWFPVTLYEEMERCRDADPDAYAHIWGGEPRVISDAQIFRGRYDIMAFETPENVRFFHGVDWGFACLKGDTLVTTEKGDVPIQDIKVGDRVLTRDGYKEVLFTKNKGYKPVYDVDFGYGVHIIATGDHKVFTYDGWKKVEDLKGHEEICTMKLNLTARFINLSLLPEKEEVFDITVENGEFFANGVLVHNCDPTALIRMYVTDGILYVDQEAYGTGIELDELPELFRTIPTTRNWPIKADSARPETISYMARKGFHITGAKKWAGSVQDGIALLKSFTRIVVHPRCVHTADEMRLYSYKVDRINGDILPIPEDAWNHCIAGGEFVTTRRGDIPVEQVRVGDEVLTRDGWHAVTASWQTGNREVVTVATAHASIRCTADHKVFTVNRGFVEAGDLRKGDVLCLLQKCFYKSGAFAPECVLFITPPSSEKVAVYDLTVEGSHEFFVNGILVHNCVDAMRYALDGYVHRSVLNINPAAVAPRLGLRI